jgi:hypothetical protein
MAFGPTFSIRIVQIIISPSLHGLTASAEQHKQFGVNSC